MIRMMKETDAQRVADITNHAILNEFGVYREAPTLASEQIERLHDAQAHNYPFFVYEIDHQVVGYATYGDFRKYYGYRFSVEDSIYIDPAYQGRHIASELMVELIAAARDRGMHIIVGAIDSNNVGSIKLHEKYGFVGCGTLPEIAIKKGRYLDLCLYIKNLATPQD